MLAAWTHMIDFVCFLLVNKIDQNNLSNLIGQKIANYEPNSL